MKKYATLVLALAVMLVSAQTKVNVSLPSLSLPLFPQGSENGSLSIGLSSDFNGFGTSFELKQALASPLYLSLSSSGVVGKIEATGIRDYKADYTIANFNAGLGYHLPKKGLWMRELSYQAQLSVSSYYLDDYALGAYDLYTSIALEHSAFLFLSKDQKNTPLYVIGLAYSELKDGLNSLPYGNYPDLFIGPETGSQALFLKPGVGFRSYFGKHLNYSFLLCSNLAVWKKGTFRHSIMAKFLLDINWYRESAS